MFDASILLEQINLARNSTPITEQASPFWAGQLEGKANGVLGQAEPLDWRP
jgi:hypothetical protein